MHCTAVLGIISCEESCRRREGARAERMLSARLDLSEASYLHRERARCEAVLLRSISVRANHRVDLARVLEPSVHRRSTSVQASRCVAIENAREPNMYRRARRRFERGVGSILRVHSAHQSDIQRRCALLEVGC